MILIDFNGCDAKFLMLFTILITFSDRMGNCLSFSRIPGSGQEMSNGQKSGSWLPDGSANLENVDDPAFAKIIALLLVQEIILRLISFLIFLETMLRYELVYPAPYFSLL